MEQPETQSQQKILAIPYIADVSEKFKRIFGKHHVPVHFKPTTTLRQRFVHPKDWTPKHNRSNIVLHSQPQNKDVRQIIWVKYRPYFIDIKFKFAILWQRGACYSV